MKRLAGMNETSPGDAKGSQGQEHEGARLVQRVDGGECGGME